MSAEIIETWPPAKAFMVRWMKRLQLERARKVSGTRSWELFQERAKLRDGPRKEYLSQRDREKIAYGLYVEIERLEQHPELCAREFGKSSLIVAAGLGDRHEVAPTKRLRELTLDPALTGQQLSRRIGALAARHQPYRQLIEALLTFSVENRDAICRRIFTGTSFSGMEVDVNRNRAMVRTLDSLVRRIDRLVSGVGEGLPLWEWFQATAREKHGRSRTGRLGNWPLFDMEAFDEAGTKAAAAANAGFWIHPLHRYGLAAQEAVDSCLVDTHLDFYDALLYLPRVYLGCAIYFDQWRGIATEGEHLDGMCRSQQEIAEVRDLATDRLLIYHRPAGQPYYRQHASDDLPMEGEGHCWLVIYPTRDEKRLAPLLYWNQGEAGVHVCTVDDETIDALSYFHVVDPVSLKPVTLFDRVQVLLQAPDGLIEKAWARTAFDFLDNPVLRRARTRSSGD